MARGGFTLIQAAIVSSVIALLGLVLLAAMRQGDATARDSKQRLRGFRIWAAIMAANQEREALGLSSIWPRDLGFDATRTSTEYFESLMCDPAGHRATAPGLPVCPDLKPSMLGGPGLPPAGGRAVFSRSNNAWQVVCVSTQTVPDVAFLVSRNVEMGMQVNATAVLRLNDERPFDATPVFGLPGVARVWGLEADT